MMDVEAICNWVRRYLQFCQQRKYSKANCTAEKAVELFLSSLANELDVTANTQNQAFSALCYLYRKVWARPLENVSALRAKRPETGREESLGGARKEASSAGRAATQSAAASHCAAAIESVCGLNAS